MSVMEMEPSTSMAAAVGLLLFLMVIAYLAAARWLQQRSAWLTPLVEVDAVYILAGAPPRGERLDAVIAWARQYDCRPATILIPQDPTAGLYPNKAGKPVTPAQWQTEQLQESLTSRRPHPSDLRFLTSDFLPPPPRPHSRFADIIVVPGYYHGTDGEMQALAAFLDPNPSFRRVALVTSRSHIRRALQRARTHIASPRILGVIPARNTLRDYSPQRVIPEYLQLLRDILGLTHAPFLHRGWRAC
ncbi:MAG: hypothetical protein HQ523_01580 [Lentisphaerae bacterium]|nr:hypothetical protein [Lentisphaerota bacterium]